MFLNLWELAGTRDVETNWYSYSHSAIRFAESVEVGGV